MALADVLASRPRYWLAQDSADKLTENFTSPPIPVQEIAQRNGVEVVFASFTKFDDVVAGFCDFEGKKLFVNAKDPRTRQRFTIAHELGHWMLHREYYLSHPEQYPVLPRFSETDKSDPLEKEANCFAANLLVPKKLLLPVKDAFVRTLANIFDVSVVMMENRLKNV